MNNPLHNKDFRNQLKQNNVDCFRQLGLDTDSDIEYRVVESNKDTIYFVIPQQSATVDVENIQAAGNCASTVGSSGSFMCLCSTASTLGCAGCAGSA